MKRITILLAFLLCATALFAQAPEKFTYQAVVRNASNSLVANAPVGVRVSILQGSASGNAVYMELHTATTNANGLLTLVIGGGAEQQGTFADIDWANGPFFLKTEIDPNSGANYSITNTQQMLSVPYALYSKEAGNGFSGDYNDLTNLPQIPQIPENVSAFNNDAGYITMDSVPTIPTNVSAFTNDAGYLTSFTEQQILTISNDTIFLTGGSFVKLPEGFDGDYNSLTNKPVLFDGDYNSLTNQPTIPTVPTNVSAFTNDAGYLTSFTEQQILTISNDTIFLTGGSFVKLPEGFDGDYNSLINKPMLFSGDYNDLTNAPVIPTVPTNVSVFNNDAGYLTSFTEQQILTISNDTIFLTGGSFVKLPDGFDGDYNSLINQPVIPTVPTVVSAFTNDAGYITMDSVPTIPTVVSAFTNDAGYLTGYTETQTLSDVTAIGNSAGSRQLKDVSDPTEAYDAVNLRTLTLLMDSLRNTFQQQLQQLQQLQQQMQQQIDSLQEIVNALDTNHHTDNFVCGTSTLTDYEGNVYATVQIGNQCWMRDNLRTTHYADGTAIPLDSSYTSSAEPYYYDYSSSIIPLTQRGYLYNWPAVMRGASSSSANPSGVQGICPNGWHVPSDAEWTQLTNYVSGQSECLCSNNTEYIAKALAAIAGWTSSTTTCAVGNTQSSNNATGFSAVPAGYYDSMGFNSSDSYAYFWSSTETSVGVAWGRGLVSSYAYVGRYGYFKSYANSVRCLRDTTGGSSDSTQISLPTVTTDSVTAITTTSATLYGTISNPDNVTITAQGFEWKTAEDSNYTTVNASGETMSYNLTGLTANTSYSYRAFVTTAEGTGYGEEVSFTTTAAAAPQGGQPCPGTATVTDYDGNVYNTVQIGQQCWMKENLRTSRTPDGTIISGRYYPNNDSNNVAVYGYLYHWFAVMDGASSSSATPSGVQGICPTGWHVPSNEEWTELEIYLGSQSQYICNNDSYCIAKALASTTGWNSPDGICFCCVGNNQSSNNATGFDALPSGTYYFDSSVSFGENAYYWSSTEGEGSIAWLFCLNNGEAEVIQNTYYKSNGLSVRCLRD